MAISDVEIARLVTSSEPILRPFSTKYLSPAGYDLRCYRRLVIPPNEHRLANTLEEVRMPKDLLGLMHIRSSFAREGILASLALIDPGFHGQLTISLYNSSKKRIMIKKNERFIQVSFVRLGSTPSSLYRGRYQWSRGVVTSKRMQ